MYFVLYIIFSLKTLISFFCFIIIIFLISFLLLLLQIEYLTLLILLLYLGGILIFFLFTALMLNNEYSTKKNITLYSFENIFLFLISFKFFYIVTYFNYKLCYLKINISLDYVPSLIENNYFLKDIMKNHGDALMLLNIFTEKSILLFLLGIILLFTMLGAIVITKK